MSFPIEINQDDDRKPSAGAERPPGWREVLLGVLPFGLAGLGFLYWGWDHILSRPSWYGRTYFFLDNGYYVLMAVFALLFVGLGSGWAKGFPRWTFAYAGMVLMSELVFGGIAINALPLIGDPFNPERRNLEGWAMLPLLIVVAAVLLSRRSLRPLLWPLQKIWQDWTNLSFLLFASLMVFFVSIGQDSLQRVSDLYPSIPAMVIFSLAALAFLRSQSAIQRAASLWIGMMVFFFLSILTEAIRSGDALAAVGGLPRLIILLVFWSALLLAPGLLGLLKRGIGARRAV